MPTTTLSVLKPAYPNKVPVYFARWQRMIQAELKQVEAKAGTLPYEDAPQSYGLTNEDIIHSNFPTPVTKTDYDLYLKK